MLDHLLRGWTDLAPTDRLTILSGPDGPAFTPPTGAEVVTLTPKVSGPAGGLWLRTLGVRRAVRDLRPDALLCGVPASGLVPTACPRGVILYDLRHELRPHQFSRKERAARAVSWRWSLRHADGIYTISERTADDVRRLHPGLADRTVPAQLGSDHADAWPDREAEEPPYALAFGHFANKNADAVIDGWAQWCSRPESGSWRLRLVGMGSADRAAAQERVTRLGVGDRVELMPWLDEESFVHCFTGAGLVVFPSDFEGFGLPAAEALRLGIPVVVSDDAALAEVTGGHAVTAASTSAADLAAAMATAIGLTPDALAAGQRFAADFTWRRTASVVRSGLLAAAGQTAR